MHGQISINHYIFINSDGVKGLDFEKKKNFKLSVNEVFNESSSRYTRVTNTLGKLQFTNEYGVATLDDSFKVTSLFRTPKELDSHFSFIDRDGNIWAASFKNGVYFIPKTAQVKTLFLAQKVKDICKNKDNIFINIEGEGAYKLNSSSFVPEIVIPTEQFLYGIFSDESSGYNYLTTRFEIYKWKEGQKIMRIDPVNPNMLNIKARQLETSGKYGFGNSAMHINKIYLEDFAIQKKIDFLGVFALLELEDHLLVGTSKGVYSINKELDETSKLSLLDTHVTCLELLHNQDVIIGSDGYGAYVLRNHQVIKIQGSDDYIVEDIAEDEMGTIYLATNEGIIVFETFEDTYKLSRKILKSDGLKSNKVNTILVSGSYLLAGGDDGLAVLDLNLLSKQATQPEIYLDHIKIGENRFKKDTIVTRFNDDHTVLANFGVLDFKGQSSIQRAYQLIPTSTDWNPIESNQINIGNLEPNTYNLRFKVSDHKGSICKKEVILTVTPLWYQTSLFEALLLVLIILTIALIIYLLFRYFQRQKTAKLTKEKKIAQIELKALRSQMNPHFVFNSLAAIQYYINNNENEVSEKYLIKFSKLIRRFFQISGENEILLKEEIELLKGYLEIEKLRFKDKLNFTITVDEDINKEEFSIPTMLLQPIVENAVNHGVFNKEDNGLVEVSFNKLSEQELQVTIIDDGVGYKKTKIRSKNKKSSNVTAERLHILNQSGKWYITHTTNDAFPEKFYPGTLVMINIKNIK